MAPGEGRSRRKRRRRREGRTEKRAGKSCGEERGVGRRDGLEGRGGGSVEGRWEDWVGEGRAGESERSWRNAPRTGSSAEWKPVSAAARGVRLSVPSPLGLRGDPGFPAHWPGTHAPRCVILLFLTWLPTLPTCSNLLLHPSSYLPLHYTR